MLECPLGKLQVSGSLDWLAGGEVSLGPGCPCGYQAEGLPAGWSELRGDESQSPNDHCTCASLVELLDLGQVILGFRGAASRYWSWCGSTNPAYVCTVYVQVEHKKWSFPIPLVLEKVLVVSLPF